MANHFSWLNDQLSQLEASGLVRKRRQVVPLADGWCELGGRKLRNFASNDYLNLAHDQRVMEAARQAVDAAGFGATASPLVVGRTDWHARLETQLAEFEGQERAILFPSGYAANLGTLSALAGEGDIIFSDRLNHASMIDGCRLSRAHIHVYRRDQLDALERELQQAGHYRHRFIVTDSLFSMDGDVAPLDQLCDLADRFDASLIVDEAHATGQLGERGRGVAEWMNVEDRVAVRVGTLSKAIGSLGGFVTGEHELIDWLWNRARTQIYSTALPPSACAAASKAIEIIQEEPWRRERVHSLAEQLRTGVSEAGLATTPNGVGSIVPVILNDPDSVMKASARLEEAGILVAAIRPPSVPKNASRLRFSVTAAHTEEDIDQLLAKLCRSCRVPA